MPRKRSALTPSRKPRVAFDPEAMINRAIDANLDPAVWDAYDDSALPQAANVIRWSIDPHFMNSGLFTKQAEILVRVFAEYCPECSDPKYLENVPVQDMSGMANFQDRVQLLEFGLCPKCSKNRVELFSTIPEEMIAVWGQRSGKSMVSSKACLYQVHRFLKIPHPAKYYGQDPSQKFDIVFTASNMAQAKSTLWSTFMTAHNTSPWFKQYRHFMDAKAKELGMPSQIKIMETYIYYGGPKNIEITFKAPSLSGLRGDTRILTVTDELSYMGQTGDEKRANAKEVYTSLANSLRTIRSASSRLRGRGDYNAPTAIMINISSPVSVTDKMMQLLREAEIDKTKIASHHATWEINPQVARSDLSNVELTDPARFLRDFCATPPLGANAFIGTEKNLENILDPSARSAFNTKIVYVEDGVNQSRYVGAQLIEASISADRQTPRLLCVDAGETGNSFAIGMYSAQSASQGGDVVLRADAVVEVSPEEDRINDRRTPVHFPTMTNLIIDICKRFNVLMVVWDRWQSTGEIQRLRDAKIPSEKYSPKYEDFLTLRNRVFSGTYKAPPPELGIGNLKSLDVSNKQQVQLNPWSHFYVQLATVRASGKKVIKPEMGDDDMFRTSVLASRYLSDNKMAIQMLTATSLAMVGTNRPGSRVGAQVIVAHYGGGSNGPSSGPTPGSGSAIVMRNRTLVR